MSLSRVILIIILTIEGALNPSAYCNENYGKDPDELDREVFRNFYTYTNQENDPEP